MKYTHNALTSISVEKVENITTSMTRAGLGDDTYRRQRQKQRYLKCKHEQAEKEERMRDDFMKQRGEKMKQSESITEKKSLKRQKKKEMQKQRQKKIKLLKKIGEGDSDSEEADSHQQQGDNNAQQQNNNNDTQNAHHQNPAMPNDLQDIHEENIQQNQNKKAPECQQQADGQNDEQEVNQIAQEQQQQQQQQQ